MSTPLIGLARLTRMAYAGEDLQPTWDALAARVGADSGDAAALLDLSTLLLLTGQRAQGLELQAAAIRLSALFRRNGGGPGALRVLAIVTAGDLMANTPLDFLLEGAEVELHWLYVDAASPLPAALPEHDVAFLAVGESDANAPVLARLAKVLSGWPRPVVNGAPERIAALTRDGVCAVFEGDPQVVAPRTVRASRADLEAVAAAVMPLTVLLPGAAFPIIARPLDSHAGAGLSKLNSAVELAAYLAERPGPLFYLAPFVDYRSPDKLWRKQRIAFVDGRPFISHMAISSHWMVHYLSAGMAEDAGKRAEEARFMADFDAGFAVRHRAAFASLHRRLGLDYFGIDCAELPDGRLLLFEADVAMIVHAMDAEDLYPYKRPAMDKLFAAFRTSLLAHATGGRGS